MHPSSPALQKHCPVVQELLGWLQTGLGCEQGSLQWGQPASVPGPAPGGIPTSMT